MQKRDAFEIQKNPQKSDRGRKREYGKVVGVVGRVWDMCAEWKWTVLKITWLRRRRW